MSDVEVTPEAVAGPERTLRVMHTHPKVLFVPTVLGFACVAAAVVAFATVQAASIGGWGRQAATGGCLLAFIALTAVPVWSWTTATFTVTTRAIRIRTGILYRNGSDIPVSRITNVEVHRGILDRIVGCGTLVVKHAADPEGVRLDDVPDAERVRSLINELVHACAGKDGLPDQAGA